MLDATVRALEAILIKEKELKEAFVTSMLQHPSFSASLIRLLTCALLRPNLEDLPAAQVMTQVAASFLNDNSKKRVTVFKTSPLWKLLEDFLAKRAKKNVVTKPKVILRMSRVASVFDLFEFFRFFCVFGFSDLSS